MTEQLEGQVSMFDQDFWYGKMSPERSAPTREKTFKRSSRKSSASQTQMPPMFLYLRRGNGQKPEASWDTEKTDVLFPSPIDYTMRSTGEQPSTLMTECNYNEGPHRGASVSRLSQILEDLPHQKYCLSAKACQGILNRAERRGKTLPPELKAALEAQSVSGNEPENQGGGKGILIQGEHVGALSTLNNQSVMQPIPIHDKATRFQGGGKNRHDDGGGNGFGVGQPDDPVWALSTADRHSVFALEGNGTRESHKGPGYSENDISYTLNSVEQHGVSYGINQQGCKGNASFTAWDVYNHTLTGDITVAINANSCTSANHMGPALLQNDLGDNDNDFENADGEEVF